METKTKSPEHEVENALLEEFRKRIGAEKILHNIQPILLHGNFFQMPTPLKASTHTPTYAQHSGGGIDMLARIKTKGTGHTRLCVIEIKDENKSSESQKAAMSQIRYSVPALHRTSSWPAQPPHLKGQCLQPHRDTPVCPETLISG